MKIVLKILTILLIASVVAGGLSLAVNNTSTTSSSTEGNQLPTMNAANGQPMSHPEGGDKDGGSIAGGLSGIFFTLVKLTGITAIVLLLEKGFIMLDGRKLNTAQR